MKVKPKTPRTIVRDPASKLPIPATGKHVPNNSYWRRRIKAGDVIEIFESPPPPPPAPDFADASNTGEGPTEGVEARIVTVPVTLDEEEEIEPKPEPKRKSKKRKRK